MIGAIQEMVTLAGEDLSRVIAIKQNVQFKIELPFLLPESSAKTIYAKEFFGFRYRAGDEMNAKPDLEIVMRLSH